MIRGRCRRGRASVAGWESVRQARIRGLASHMSGPLELYKPKCDRYRRALFGPVVKFSGYGCIQSIWGIAKLPEGGGLCCASFRWEPNDGEFPGCILGRFRLSG